MTDAANPDTPKTFDQIADALDALRPPSGHWIIGVATVESGQAYAHLAWVPRNFGFVPTHTDCGKELLAPGAIADSVPGTWPDLCQACVDANLRSGRVSPDSYTARAGNHE